MVSRGTLRALVGKHKIPAMRIAGRVTAVLLCAAASASAQSTAIAGKCYRFDRPYFTAVGRFPGEPVFIVRADVLKLRADSTPFTGRGLRRFAMKAVEPMPFVVDSFTYRRWMSVSGWRMIGSDSVEIEWRNGLYGPVFRMAVRGDSLVGEVIETTDSRPVPRPPPAPDTTRATRISCGG